VQSHGPLLTELARLEEQVYELRDVIDRQADMIAALHRALADRPPDGIQCACGRSDA
jgi:hypothetical protein